MKMPKKKKWTRKRLKRLLNRFPSYCVPWSMDKKMAKAIGVSKKDMMNSRIMNPSITVQWSGKGYGFGEFTFYNKKVNGKWKVFCDNECCDKGFIHLMLNKMVDDCILTEHYKDGTPK